jgi:hypothetical protein
MLTAVLRQVSSQQQQEQGGLSQQQEGKTALRRPHNQLLWLLQLFQGQMQMELLWCT